MKKSLLIVIGFLFYHATFSNINSIDLNKVTFTLEIKDDLNFVLENQSWFNHWSPDWTYNISKKKCLKRLKYISLICDNNAKTYEDYLLKGVIAHFRYNLNDKKQFQVSINAFRDALEIKPNDYRAYWYIGNHYAHSAVPDSSVIYFLKAELKNDDINNSEFWEEYAFAFNSANMPSHCIYGMEKANETLGEKCYFDRMLGKVVRDRLSSPDPSSTFEAKDIWSYDKDGRNSIFISRLLGIKFLVDSAWTLSLGEFTNKMSYIIITPNAETSDEGRDITYTIMIMVHIPKEGETIEMYSDRFVGDYTDKRSHDRYVFMNPSLSYEIEDSLMYPDMGGGHLQFMSLLKEYPDNPGLILEVPRKLPKSKKKKVSYYSLSPTFNRLDGELMYVILLDTCEDIYEKSMEVYDDFLSKLIIE